MHDAQCFNHAVLDSSGREHVLMDWAARLAPAWCDWNVAKKWVQSRKSKRKKPKKVNESIIKRRGRQNYCSADV